MLLLMLESSQPEKEVIDAASIDTDIDRELHFILGTSVKKRQNADTSK